MIFLDMSKSELFEYFLNSDINLTYILQKNLFKKLYPEIYTEFTNWDIPEEGKTWKFKQQIWHFLQDDLNLKLGLCPVCGKRCKLVRFRLGYRQTCSIQCSNQSQEHKDKAKETCLEKYGSEFYSSTLEGQQRIKQTKLDRYGDENYNNRDKAKETCQERYGTEYYSQSEIGKESILNTWETKDRELHRQKSREGCIEKWGVENYTQTDEYKIKSKETCQKKYGVDNYAKTPEFKEKSQQTCQEKYGTDYYTQTDEYKERSRKTCQERYGCDTYLQTKDYQRKAYITKKKNHTFNSSKIEEELAQWLTENNINHIRQYKSELYPYCCDFYLPEYDLYIEVQGSWTHGFHPFDENNPNDIEKLHIWKEKSKTSEYYKNAIEVWTECDVSKRLTAIQNNLNYLEIFSTDLLVCIKSINEKLHQ